MAKQTKVSEQMSMEDMRRLVAENDAIEAGAAADRVIVVNAEPARASYVAGSAGVLGAVSGAVVGGVSANGGGFALPSDLEADFSSSEAAVEVEDKVSTAVKFSIVGNRFKAVNVYFSQNEAGVNGMRIVKAIIQQSGLKYTPVTKTTKTEWKDGKASEVACVPYRFYKLAASANSLSAAKLLVQLASSVQANGLDWS